MAQSRQWKCGATGARRGMEIHLSIGGYRLWNIQRQLWKLILTKHIQVYFQFEADVFSHVLRLTMYM